MFCTKNKNSPESHELINENLIRCSLNYIYFLKMEKLYSNDFMSIWNILEEKNRFKYSLCFQIPNSDETNVALLNVENFINTLMLFQLGW